jgi:LacI family transcriptional regulator
MPTIHDVAERAGVAPTTVSRVINNSGYVSDATRQRVETAIEELGYVPNRLARSLRLKRTHTLGLVVTDITNPFWPAVARGVEDAAHAAGFSVILCNTDESEAKQKQYLDVLLQKRVDGILLAPACASPELLDWIRDQTTPVVLVDRRVDDAQVDVVRGDSEDGAFRLVQHLISLGHQHIAVLSGPKDVSTATDRVDGYCRALKESGLRVQAEWIRYGAFSQESGREMAEQALATSPPPTALFAANNFIAVGALQALQHKGLQVPRDVSLVSFDDLMSSMVIAPFLTVADQPAYDMGQRAAALLLTRLSGANDTGFQEVVLPVKVTIRHSTGHPGVTQAAE